MAIIFVSYMTSSTTSKQNENVSRLNEKKDAAAQI
jgi:hypothetical protein